MADEKTCRFCGASLHQDAKYCEECWKSLTSASQLPSQHSERPSTAPPKRTFGWLFHVTLTRKKMLAGGTLLILFLLIIGTMASPYSHSNSASHIDGRAMAPPLKLSPQTEEDRSANIAITPSLAPPPPPTQKPETTVAPTPASTCECPQPCVNVLYAPETPASNPSVTPTPTPTPTASPYPAPTLLWPPMSTPLPDQVIMLPLPDQVLMLPLP